MAPEGDSSNVRSCAKVTLADRGATRDFDGFDVPHEASRLLCRHLTKEPHMSLTTKKAAGTSTHHAITDPTIPGGQSRPTGSAPGRLD